MVVNLFNLDGIELFNVWFNLKLEMLSYHTAQVIKIKSQITSLSAFNGLVFKFNVSDVDLGFQFFNIACHFGYFLFILTLELPLKLHHFAFQLLVVASFDEEVLFEVQAIGAAFGEWEL